MKTIALIIEDTVYHVNEALQRYIIEKQESRGVEFIGFTPEASTEGRYTMFVQFKGGASYVYQGVPMNVKDAARSAESIGSFVGKNIVGKYPSVKLKFVGVVKEAETQPVKTPPVTQDLPI